MIKKFLVNEGLSIKQAMKQIGVASEKILFVVDKDGVLRGTLTDGDVRRWILRKGSLSASIKEIYNRDPICVQEGYDLEKVKGCMVSSKLVSIPVVDQEQVITDILFWEDVFGDKHKEIGTKIDIPVVIMAGGKGKRMDPFTRILPKPLIPVDEKPAVEWIMDNFSDHGCTKFLLVLGYKGEMIKSYFDNTRVHYQIHYVWEKEAGGTAGGLRLLSDRKDIPKTFFLSNCDSIIKADCSQLYEYHRSNNHDITIVSCMKHWEIPYGVIELNRGKLKEIVEKPEYDFLVNTGMYLIEKRVLKSIPAGQMFHMTDLIKKVKSGGGRVGIYPVNEKAWLDIGEWEKYKEIVKKFEL